MENTICRICGYADTNQTYLVLEMHHGIRDSFNYFQCNHCDCLQIVSIPRDMSKYYPEDYYSFRTDFQNEYTTSLKNVRKRVKEYYTIFNKKVLGRLIKSRAPRQILVVLSRIKNLHTKSRILDVGCGSGELLYKLRELGFKNLLGIDPYVHDDIHYPNGLRILKKSIHSLDDEWDIIMYNHSLEHIPDQDDDLQAVKRLLTPDGSCLIRVPTVSSDAWEQYREQWVQIDAPRHFYLHSVKSMSLLAEKNGFFIDDLMYDSSCFQFYGSELYRKGLPLVYLNPSNVYTVFSREQMAAWESQAQALNMRKRGDQAAFYLKKR